MRWAAVIAALLAACAQPVDEPSAPLPVRSAPSAPVDATALFAKFECNRCHDGLPIPDVHHDKHCVRCHREIAAGQFDAPAEALERWRRNIHSLLAVPSLRSTGRLGRAWVRDHLLEPVDARPALFATMPRLDISQRDAERMAAQLVPAEAPPVEFRSWDAAAGAVLYRQLGCASCHRFSGVDRGPAPQTFGNAERPSTEAIALAPDLALTRDRFQSGRLASWLINPQGMDRESLMPSFDLSPDAARQLAAFVFLQPAASPAVPAVPERLPVLDRKVRYDEVADRVFRKICWHCHSEPDLARGDGGPGNSGGFGFAPAGLDLSSYTGVLSGSIGPDGKRRSVLASGETGTSILVTRLLARHSEQAGEPVPGVRGMPLGLPALSPEQIQLVETWLAQGRPR